MLLVYIESYLKNTSTGVSNLQKNGFDVWMKTQHLVNMFSGQSSSEWSWSVETLVKLLTVLSNMLISFGPELLERSLWSSSLTKAMGMMIGWDQDVGQPDVASNFCSQGYRDDAFFNGSGTSAHHSGQVLQ